MSVKRTAVLARSLLRPVRRDCCSHRYTIATSYAHCMPVGHEFDSTRAWPPRKQQQTRKARLNKIHPQKQRRTTTCAFKQIDWSSLSEAPGGQTHLNATSRVQAVCLYTLHIFAYHAHGRGKQARANRQALATFLTHTRVWSLRKLMYDETFTKKKNTKRRKERGRPGTFAVSENIGQDCKNK